MNHAPLFTGINGFGLAADWMGWNQPFHVEIDEFCQRIIQYYWPKSTPYNDIKKTDFTKYRGTIDIVSGGPPCQPISVAGKRKGKEDDRWLWHEAIRAIEEIKPKYAVFENPPGILTMDHGKLFEGILLALEDQGYRIEIFNVPAASLQAPHKRERIWIIAYFDSKRYSIRTTSKNRDEGKSNGKKEQEIKNRIWSKTNGFSNYTINSDNSGCKNRQLDGQTLPKSNKRRENATQYNAKIKVNDNANPKSKGYKRTNTTGKVQTGRWDSKYINGQWDKWPTQSPICIGNDGISSRLHGITFSKLRRESIKAAGNAIVPQIAYELFKAIKEYDEQINK